MSVAWRQGTGAPANTLGANGDYYYDLATANVWLRTAGVYAIVVNAGQTLNANALCTIDDALLMLRRNRVIGTASDDDIRMVTIEINSVSDAITRLTQREFFPTNSAVRTFEYLGNSRGYLDFAPYDLRDVSSITLGGQALTASAGAGDGDYVPFPRNQTLEGTYTYMAIRGYYRLGSELLQAPVLDTRDVVITGDWGMAAIPPAANRACLIAVCDLYRNPEQADSRGSGDFQITEEPRAAGADGLLPTGALDLLETFMRPKVG